MAGTEPSTIHEEMAPYGASIPPSQLTFSWPEGDRLQPEYVEIQSRRYLGSKSRLLPFLHRIVAERCGPYESFGDLFAGTGVVAHSFNRPGIRIVANDYLESNAACLSCWLGITELNLTDAAGLLAHLNSLSADEENYVSEQYGDRYFSRETARKIGAVRDEIDRLSLSPALRALSLTSLIYAMDRVARTVGHYDAYRRSADSGDLERDRPFRLMFPHFDAQANLGNEIYRRDANALIREVEVDLLYLDPPYNSRQYSDTYHVLENIIQNDKPPLIGVARKRPGRPSRSRYCGKDAAKALEDLVMHAHCRWILFSYNNMTGGDKRSNAILTEDQILALLRLRGSVEVYRTAFNSFTSKRELIPGHEERVYVCEVQSSKLEVQGSRFKVQGSIPEASTTSTLNFEQGTLNAAPEATP